jgi:hypothetical protein
VPVRAFFKKRLTASQQTKKRLTASLPPVWVAATPDAAARDGRLAEGEDGRRVRIRDGRRALRTTNDLAMDRANRYKFVFNLFMEKTHGH